MFPNPNIPDTSVTILGEGRVVVGLDIDEVDRYVEETKGAPFADAHMQHAKELVNIDEMSDDEINDLIGRAIHGGSITYPVLGEV